MNRYISNDLFYYSFQIFNREKSCFYEDMEKNLTKEIEILHARILDCKKLNRRNDVLKIQFNWNHRYNNFERLMDNFLHFHFPIHNLKNLKNSRYLILDIKKVSIFDNGIFFPPPQRLLSYLSKKFGGYKSSWKNASQHLSYLKGNLGLFEIKEGYELNLLEIRKMNTIYNKLREDYCINVKNVQWYS